MNEATPSNRIDAWLSIAIGRWQGVRHWSFPLAALMLAGCVAAPLSDGQVNRLEIILADIERSGQWNGNRIAGPWDIDGKIFDEPEPTACHSDLSSVGAPIHDLTPDLYNKLNRLNLDSGGKALNRMAGISLVPRMAKFIDLEPAIYIDPRLGPLARAYVLHHERCHWLTGWAHPTGGGANRPPRDLDGQVLP